MVDCGELTARLEALSGGESLKPKELFAVDGFVPRVVAAPEVTDQVCALLKAADESGAAVVPWGGGTNQNLGNVPDRVDTVLCTARLNRMVAHEPADMTCVAEAGIRLSDLQEELAKEGQFLPIDPPDLGSTVGGILSANVSGPMRLAYGSPRDVVIGTKVALVSGDLVKAGGRVVKNVSGFDLNKLYVGALGTLGIIVEVAFKVLPSPERRASVAAVYDRLEEASEGIRTILRGDMTPCAINLISPRATTRIGRGAPLPGDGFVVLVRVEGVDESVRDQVESLETLFFQSGSEKIERLERNEDYAVWDAVRGYRRDGKGTIRSKASLPLKCVRNFIHQAEALRTRHEISFDLISHAASGIVLCYFDLESPEGVDKAVAAAGDLRAISSELGGNLVVESAPPAFKKRLDVWGKWGPELAIMRSLKSKYDPKRTLNPGRFVGGI